MNQERITLWAAVTFLLVPLLAALAILGWFLIPNIAEHAAGFLLLFTPGAAVFAVGLAQGIARWRDPSRRLRAMRIRIVGQLLLYLIPDLWFVWAILTGETSPMAWPAVVVLSIFAALQAVVLTSVRMPEQTTETTAKT